MLLSPFAHRRWSVLNAIALLAMLILCFLLVFPTTARADIRTIEEAPGQVLYQTRETLKDQHGNRWQAIAFKRHKAETEIMGLRLVGFPGKAVIDRSQPLTLVDSLGNTFTAADTSAKIFTDESAPEPHIGQYDLSSFVADLQAAVPLEVKVPLENDAEAVLVIAPPTIQDWQTLSTMG